MKYSFELSGHRRANVWLDEAPPTAYTALSVEAKVVKPKSAIDATRRIAGVEVNFPHGPKSSYALLGAELIEAEVEGLEVSASVNGFGTPFSASLANKLDRVRVGLPDEFAAAVICGAARIAEEAGAPVKRKLWFRWAAHGFVNSSPFVFEQVGGIVLELLSIRSVGEETLIRALLERATIR
jgi:hypothetical protein